MLEFDPPGIGKTSDASQLRLSDYAAAMANRIRKVDLTRGRSSGTALEDWWRSGWRSARSPIRRAHERLVASIPDAHLAISEGTSHPLQIRQPANVAEVTLALLERA